MNEEQRQKSREASLRYFNKNKQKQRDGGKRWRERIKREVIEHYGGTPPECACCKEDIYDFLTVDHLNNDGTAERKKHGTGGHHNYRFIIKNNFPENKYQILCYNCNCARGKKNANGICPHENNPYRRT